ncbi:MAG: galactonate dehydratase [Bryobacteraceae bacterium]|nr:galactonate dehydratase [Bryobacteraceae bacterium]
MKIAAIKTVVVNAQMRNWVFVKVETDRPGLVGWGEASLEWKTRAVAGAVEDLAPFILGDDPTRIEHIYQKLYRQPFFRPGVIGQSAISGIEQACWDIAGKALGVPVYKLLGGAVRDRVRMYTHLGGGQMEAVYASFDPGPVVDLAREVVARGYTAVKVVFVPYSEPLMGPSYARKFAAVMARLREAVGDAVDIMIDFHGRTYPAVAIEYINAVAEFHPFFCEEPVPSENIDALAQVRQAVRVPIATGERLVTRHQFREVFEKQAAHVIQPDLCHCGGLWEAKKIAAMAETYYLGVAPHNPLGPVANAAALHFALSTPNFLIQEDMLSDVPWRWDVVQSSLKTENGYWLPTETPGLGVEVDEREAAKHPFRQETLQSVVYAPDGAVLDW